MLTLINKSISATLLISLGNFALLKLGLPLGAIIFSFGLIGICYMDLNLFTGKCGFLIQNKIKIKDLLLILLVNLISGYLIGLLYSTLDIEIYNNAIEKVASWSPNLPYFIKSILCGMIMYISVSIYKKGTPIGIIFGIPLFILCGFQHCIANIITLGIARNVAFTNICSIILCIIGNFLGSVLMWYISKCD